MIRLRDIEVWVYLSFFISKKNHLLYLTNYCFSQKNEWLWIYVESVAILFYVDTIVFFVCYFFYFLFLLAAYLYLRYYNSFTLAQK